MDKIQDLERYPKDGDEERGRTKDLRQIPSTIRQKEQPISFPSGYQRTAEPGNNKDEGWNGHNDHNHPMGCHRPSLFNQFQVKERDVSETGGFPSSPPPSDCGVVDHTGPHLQLSIDGECDLESGQGKNRQRGFWSVGHSSQEKAQSTLRQNQTRERQTFFPSREWESGSGSRNLGVRELRRNKSLDTSIPMEARPSIQISHDSHTGKSIEVTLQKLPGVSEVVVEQGEGEEVSELIKKLKNDRFGFHPTKKKNLLSPYAIADLEEEFGITGVVPMFVDHSGSVVWMLDDHGIMYQWNDMERSVEYLGSNLRKGLANYLYHPENIYAVEDGKLVSVEEINRQLKEESLGPVEVLWDKSAEKYVNQSAKKRHKKLKKRKSNFF